jgi:hypothetical protein
MLPPDAIWETSGDALNIRSVLMYCTDVILVKIYSLQAATVKR